MKYNDLIDPSASILNQVADVVPPESIMTADVQGVITNMLTVAKGEQGDINRRTMVGLAAPQIGVLKRIIVVAINTTGLGEEPDLCIFVNPVITRMSLEQEEGREGCFSTGSICGVVKRSQNITIKGYDHKGKVIEETYAGFIARIFQHELDHLDGVRFPDRITDPQKLHWVESDQFGEYRTKWQTWESRCERSVWESMKST